MVRIFYFKSCSSNHDFCNCWLTNPSAAHIQHATPVAQEESLVPFITIELAVL